MVKRGVSVSTDVREHRNEKAATRMGKARVGATINEMEKTSVVQKPRMRKKGEGEGMLGSRRKETGGPDRKFRKHTVPVPMLLRPVSPAWDHCCPSCAAFL